MRKPASREITAASVELCDTEVCFLRVQLIGFVTHFFDIFPILHLLGLHIVQLLRF